MTTMRRLLRLVPMFWMCAGHATSRPGVLVDFTRLDAPFGVTPLPTAIGQKLPLPNDRVALRWVLFEPDGRVRVGLDEIVPHRFGHVRISRAMVLDLPDFRAYRAAVVDHPELQLSAESVEVLRSRRIEVGLNSRIPAEDENPATQPTLLEDLRVRGELPADAIKSSIKLRTVEQALGGGLRLNLSGRRANGEIFAKAIDFFDLDEFNRASGEMLVASDFNREVLSFWAYSEESRMAGRFAMKTREEVGRSCADLLRFGVHVAPSEKTAFGGSNAAGKKLILD